MTTSTAIPDWMLQHPYLQWVFPSVVLLGLVLIVVSVIINLRCKKDGNQVLKQNKKDVNKEKNT